MRWAQVSGAGEPRRWSKPCGLVQIIVQDHPAELVAHMRYVWQVSINGSLWTKGWARTARAAKSKATERARVVLEEALKHIGGRK